MHTPKLKLSTCETKQGRSDDVTKSRCSALRIWLILWACLRLVVSALWTGLLLLKTIGTVYQSQSDPEYRAQDYIVEFGCVATILQIVEFGMLVIFIIAGIKKNVKFYHIYYYYCKMTLIIYAMAVSLTLLLGYERGHYISEIYLTYHFSDFSVHLENDEMVFTIAAIWDIALEIMLIRLVKKLINKYKYNENSVIAENV